MDVPNWSLKVPQWSNETFTLLNNFTTDSNRAESIQDFIKKSDEFCVKFPIDTGRCKTLKNHISSEILERNINSVYPFVHENVLELYCQFILFKRRYGTTIEKKLYLNMDLKNFVNRLLKNRAVMFMGKADNYVLLTGEKGKNKWETIGTLNECTPLVLENCISYDEIKLSAFLSASSYTYFVNKGDRKNMGKFENKRENIANEGIIVGVIGPRLKKQGVMEYQEIVVSKTQNTKSNGYGSAAVGGSIHKLLSDFYEEPCLDFDEVNNKIDGESRYYKLTANEIFDNRYYYKRLTVSIDTLLLEANHRAKEAGKFAFVHVVGLGLGVWRISKHQDAVYMDAFAKRISILGSKLSSISDICFAWIDQEKCGHCKDGDVFQIPNHSLGGIKIHINKRNPHEKLNTDKLLVVSYAWDGNALPGNEWWSGKLGSSGDSAAASSTQITEIHNPHINSLMSANNLRIVTSDGVVPLEKYQESIRRRLKRTEEEI